MPIALWSSTVCVLPWVVPAAPPGVAEGFGWVRVGVNMAGNGHLGGSKVAVTPGVNEGVRHQRRCTTRLPLATGHVIYPSRALYPFCGEGGTAVTRFVQT